MRIIAYYITGTIIGIALMLGIWWAFPDMLQAKHEQYAKQQITQLQADNRLIANATISNSRQNAITTAVREVSPAVVGINVTAIREYRVRDPFYNDPFFRGLFPERIYRENVQNLGSGFIISPDGYVLTNEHVVHKAEQVIVTATDGEKYEAEIIGFDYDTDIALLKIEGKGFPFIPFGDSDDILIGEWAIAVGNPFGLFSIHSQPTVTVGVVSATDRDFDRNQDGKLYLDMVQTDASINRGNSGGPLVNSEGNLIGMNTMIFTETGGSIGLGFAIPSNTLKRLIGDLKTRGEVDRNFWIGLSIQNVNRLVAMSLKLPEISGVIVTEVEKGSPAAKAGLEATDVIVTMCGRKINTNQDIQQIMSNSDLRVGDTIDLDVIRGGKTVKVKLELGKKEG
jgi:serine protease Do